MIFTWLPLAIIAYMLAAVSGATDRAIVHKEKTAPIVISFWVALFSVATFALILIGFLPFEFASAFKFEMASTNIMLLALLAGFMTQAALLYMYRALEYGEATRVLSVMGGLVPIVSFIAAYLFLDERLEMLAIAGFVVLILATIILTLNPHKLSVKGSSKWIVNIIVASILLGTQAVLAKYVFTEYHFISAYATTGLGAGLYALLITLVSKNVRNEISGSFKAKKKTNKQATHSSQLVWIFGNSMLGGLAVILLNLAISLGSPTLVGALRGVQYAGIFIIAFILAGKYPNLLDEDLSRMSVLLKTLGIVLTINGIILLALSV